MTDVAAPAPKRSRLSSRKLWLAVGVEATATWLLKDKSIGEATWLVVTTTVLWGYMAGNVGQTAAESLAKVLQAITGRT